MSTDEITNEELAACAAHFRQYTDGPGYDVLRVCEALKKLRASTGFSPPQQHYSIDDFSPPSLAVEFSRLSRELVQASRESRAQEKQIVSLENELEHARSMGQQGWAKSLAYADALLLVHRSEPHVDARQLAHDKWYEISK